jgi:hypothetical protein
LFYYFSGLTYDQKYYVTAILPIRMPNLPDSVQPGYPIDITGLDSAQIEDALQAYYTNIATTLDDTQANVFMPDLEVLDNLISSISIVEE